ncbi:MAG TPA: redoxin domain-containing protein [Gemmatales bacterium]|nr:redoxin domain-containing protein [Gemmatales bacterium]
MTVVGSRAPSFHLPAFSTQRGHHALGLADYDGQWLCLIFYPRDFSMVCPTELIALSARRAQFAERDCALLGVSTDSTQDHERWITLPRSQGGLGGLEFPLASDTDGLVSQAYGVFLPRQRVALRGLFLIDPNGVLQYSVIHSLSVGRRSEEVLRVLAALQTGGLCPENWSPSDPPLDTAETLRPGTVIGSFRLLEHLGQGTFGAVFSAFDLALERPVALKLLRGSESRPAASLLAEARAAAAIQHPNVCTVYSVDQSEGIPLIVMELVPGRSLLTLLSEGPLPLPRTLDIGRQLADGMAAAPAQQVVHGDLKPANIMLTPAGQAKIMDYTGFGSLVGTPAYMAPEQTRGEPTSQASDVFSLALVLYEMATGRPAIGGTRLFDVLRQIEAVDSERLARDVPDPLADVVRRALKADPSERTLTMTEIHAHLVAVGELSD